ncbi:uncharacterized protein LOC144372393 [Ictidomys tridecemlineatus]
MNGQKGEPRLPGTVGQNGIPGPKGEPGEQGEKGDTGESGPKGDTGKRENLENLVVQGKRENQVSLVLRGNQAYQDYQEQKVNVGRQGLLEEVSEGILEPLDQRGNKVNQELEAQRGPRGDRGDKGDSGALGPRGPPGQKGDQGATEIIDYNGNLHEALQDSNSVILGSDLGVLVRPVPYRCTIAHRFPPMPMIVLVTLPTYQMIPFLD